MNTDTAVRSFLTIKTYLYKILTHLLKIGNICSPRKKDQTTGGARKFRTAEKCRAWSFSI